MACQVGEIMDLSNQIDPVASAHVAGQRLTEIGDDVDPCVEREHRLLKRVIFKARTLEEGVSKQERQPYLVDDLLRARSVNLLVGDSGLGKTPLGIQLGICVAAGVPFLGLRVPQSGPVLY